MPTDPLVSVVIPTYNQGNFLPTAIDSALAQDYQSLEVIVVDDGSTDVTPSVIARYGSRILAIRQENQGAATALNRGILEAHGELICWLSSDDEFLPGKIRRQVETFRRDPGLGLSFTGYDVVDATGNPRRQERLIDWIHPDLFVSIVWRNPVNGSTAMVPRRVFDEVGLFNPALRADVDGEMWLRILRRYRAAQIEGSFLRYRVHAAALSANPALMRSSKTAVRVPVIRDGSLTARLRASEPPSAAAVLATMSLDFTQDGLPEIASALLLASIRAGLAAARQRTAARELFRAARRRSPWFRGPWRHLPAQVSRRLWQTIRGGGRQP